jgi:hypothetical protein
MPKLRSCAPAWRNRRIISNRYRLISVHGFLKNCCCDNAMQIIIPVHRHLHRQAAPYILVVCFLLRMPRVVNAIRDVRLIMESLFSWKEFFRLQIFFKLKIVFAATASLPICSEKRYRIILLNRSHLCIPLGDFSSFEEVSLNAVVQNTIGADFHRTPLKKTRF